MFPKNIHFRSHSSFESVLKNLLVDYLHSLQLNEPSDFEFVCHMCQENPASKSIEDLTEHIKSEHLSEIHSKTALEHFLKDNITFEEPLTLEDSDWNSEPEKDPEIKLPNFHCPFCKSVFSSTTRLVFHLNQHMELRIDQGFVCCDEQYHNKKEFVTHLQNTHVSTDTDDAANVCRTCGYVSESKENLEFHVISSHERPKRKSSNKRSANDQKYTPVSCPECNKVFSNKYHMQFHLKSHTERERHFCDRCEKSYSYAGSLSQHKKFVHEGILSFLCTSCGEAFPSKQARDIHKRLHTGEAPFICQYCSKSYRSKQTLSRHIEMHLDIRNYRCHVCPKRFRRSTHLKYHLSTHEK